LHSREQSWLVDAPTGSVDCEEHGKARARVLRLRMGDVSPESKHREEAGRDTRKHRGSA
jgi:hypothetical protein